jgi:CO/xanthine dehydrogenase FAD-binding subunit
MTPLMTHGALWPETVLMLQRAGLGGIVDSIVDGGTLEIGAAATLAAVADVAPEPLASAARIPDYEIRGQATLGGNIMIGGDLQTALVAMGAHVRSAGAGGERVDPVAEFIAAPSGRLVLSVEVPRPRRWAHELDRQRQAAHDGRRAPHDVVVRAAGGARADGGQGRLPARQLRGVHGAGRR